MTAQEKAQDACTDILPRNEFEVLHEPHRGLTGQEGDTMNIKSARDNAMANIEHMKKLAREGKDFSTAVIMESERLIKVIDEIVPRISEEDWSRLAESSKKLSKNHQDLKDIKERYELTWTELDAVITWTRIETPSVSIRKKTGLSRAEFSRRYGIPLRTLENWDAGIATPPEYVLTLLDRVVEMDMQ